MSFCILSAAVLFDFILSKETGDFFTFQWKYGVSYISNVAKCINRDRSSLHPSGALPVVRSMDDVSQVMLAVISWMLTTVLAKCTEITASPHCGRFDNSVSALPMHFAAGDDATILFKTGFQYWTHSILQLDYFCLYEVWRETFFCNLIVTTRVR